MESSAGSKNGAAAWTVAFTGEVNKNEHNWNLNREGTDLWPGTEVPSGARGSHSAEDRGTALIYLSSQISSLVVFGQMTDKGNMFGEQVGTLTVKTKWAGVVNSPCSPLTGAVCEAIRL